MNPYFYLVISAALLAAGILVKRLKPIPKAAVIVGGLIVGYLGAASLGWLPAPKALQSQTVERFNLPDAADASGENAAIPVSSNAKPVVGNKQRLRFRHYAWNTHSGFILANGGKTTQRGSIMDERGVNLELIRTDSNDTFMAEAFAFASAVKGGDANPSSGTHFFSMMGDGTAPMLYKLNKRIREELGDEYQYKIIGSGGSSYGEDKFLGPKHCKDNPQSCKGIVVITVPQDGDMNIVLKWAADNGIAVNPDLRTYDPDAINFEAAPDNDYMKAAQVFVSGGSVTRKNKKTGKTETYPIEGVATWTPGDELVVTQRGGVVSIADTKLYSGQMPQAIMGCDAWMKKNRGTVEAFLAGGFEANQRIKAPGTGDAALRDAARLSAVVYKEKDEAYWFDMFKGLPATDNQGNLVELGGSKVYNLADNLRLFGIYPQGAANSFEATYTTFGKILVKLYPSDLPEIYSFAQVSDLSYVTALQGRVNTGAAESPRFSANAPIRAVSGRTVYPINFDFGQSTFGAGAQSQLEELKRALLIAESAKVEINGYTDSVGSRDANMSLSEGRANAVKRWLETAAPANFSAGRVRSKGFGPDNPVAPNTTEAGRAKNRRVEVVIGN